MLRPSEVQVCRDAVPQLVEEQPAGQRQAVAVNPAAGHPDHRVARRKAAGRRPACPGPPTRRRCRTGRIRSPLCAPRISSATCAVSPPDMLIRAWRAPSHRPAAIWAKLLLVRPLRRYVVHQRQRLRADAEQIVDVYRHAVDADRVVAAHHLRDQDLGPNVVGRDRQTPGRRPGRSRWRSIPAAGAAGPARCGRRTLPSPGRRCPRARRPWPNCRRRLARTDWYLSRLVRSSGLLARRRRGVGRRICSAVEDYARRGACPPPKIPLRRDTHPLTRPSQGHRVSGSIALRTYPTQKTINPRASCPAFRSSNASFASYMLYRFVTSSSSFSLPAL